MRVVNVFLAVLVSLSLALLVFEGGLRLFPAYRPQETINAFDAKLGWSKRPGAVVRRQTREFDVSFEINELGLRDDPMSSTEKAPNTYRVLMLGDSFVLGYTVDRKDLFVDHLERWWTAEERRVDVINAGTEGYSTDQEVLWFLEHGVDFAPDLVLIFPYENDIYWCGQATYYGKAKPRFRPDGTLESGTLADTSPPRSALDGWAVGRFLRMTLLPRLRALRGTRSGPPEHHFQATDADVWISAEFAPLLAEPPGFLADALDRTEAVLRKLDERCAELGARLVLVPIPSESAIHDEAREDFGSSPFGLRGLPADRWDPDRPVNLFLGMAKELGIETLDPRAALRAHAEASGERLYFDAEWHFNPEGNRVFAAYLHGELENLGVFPEEHGALAQVELSVPTGDRRAPTWLIVFGALWLFLGLSYALTYRDEPAWRAFLQVGCLLALVFTIILGGGRLIGALPPSLAAWILGGFVVLVLGFVAWKLGRRLATILELLKCFTRRGHWYLMPLVVVLLTIGSLLVVAASSPLIAPFIYTLF